MAGKLDRVIFGVDPDPEPAPVDEVIMEGVVYSVGAGGIKFTVPTWDNGTYLYGPAPYPPYAVGIHAAPVKGDRCLVMFPNGEPWVIGWWPHG
jgi:hypothetical protein